MIAPKPGQRWISEREPELGLGTVLETDRRTARIFFPASGELRIFALESAPLRRVEFRVGDSIKPHEGPAFTVIRVTSANDILTYHGIDGQDVPESLLSDFISFTKPEDRLLHGNSDTAEDFEWRIGCLLHQTAMRHSPDRGFLGGKIELLPHQLYIASEVAARFAPRILLSDEVGLGKTIEACLILHRLHLAGKVSRVLILVPESLVHQWFVELLRKFNMHFSIFDEERCSVIEAGTPGTNPFFDEQLVLAAIDDLAADARRSTQAVSGEWDMVIVDEAHHLEWTPAAASPRYRFVEALAANCRDLLLLTATPEQLGQESHFARLRLLDPDRYSDLATYLEEAGHYHDVAKAASNLLSDKKLTAVQRKALKGIFKDDPKAFDARLDAIAAGDATAREKLIQELLDRHGTGRVIFRNTRAALKNFPKRKALIEELAPGKDFDPAAALAEFRSDFDLAPEPSWNLDRDPRIVWLAGMLRKNKTAKVLLVCRTMAKAKAVESALRRQIAVDTVLFHEDLPLVQRDRNAAWFADPDGARILICSEIGSEGRNFQFAHHIVLFDLPPSPEMVEQRIGRLDRIGQTETIHVHVCVAAGTPQARYARWLHEGVDVFRHSAPAAGRVWDSHRDVVLPLLLDSSAGSDADFKAQVAASHSLNQEIVHQLESGRNRLLELNSFRPQAAERIVERIRRADADTTLQRFMMQALDNLGCGVEDASDHIYKVTHGHSSQEVFPQFKDDGLLIAFSRDIAKSREDVEFITWDHPMVTNVIEHTLASGKGNVTAVVWPDSGKPGFLLECWFILEPVSARRIAADTFLPPTPVRVLVDQQGREVANGPDADEISENSEAPNPESPRLTRKQLGDLLPPMLAAARNVAETRADALRKKAAAAIREGMGAEIARLEHLLALHGHIREGELQTARKTQADLEDALSKSTLRLDSIRAVLRLP